MRGDGGRRARRVLEAAGVFLAALLLYTGIPGVSGGVGDHPFLNWDDNFYILENPAIRGFTWGNFKAWWTTPYFGNYAPLHLLSYALNHDLRGGLHPGDFHVTDAALHAGASVFALFVLRRLVGPGLPAVLGALLFAFHPVQVESVAWASERKNTLAMFFLLPAFLLFLRHRDRTPDGVRSRWPTPAYLGSLACFLLSLLAKGMGVVLPVLLALHEVIHDPRPRRAGRYAELAPYFVFSLALGLATIWAQQSAGAIHADQEAAGLFYTMTGVFAEYVRTLFLPVNLNNAYYPEILQGPLRPEFVAAVAILMALLALTAAAIRRAPRAAFWSLWFFVSLGPVANLLPLTMLRADRWLYLASLSLGGLGALALDRIGRRSAIARRAAAAALVATVLCFAALSRERIALWGDAERLWRDSIAKAPRSHIAHGSLGEVYFSKGDLDRALAEYREAIRLQPRYEKGHFSIGFIEVRRGRMAAAAEALRSGLAARPEPPTWNPTTRDTYGFVHFYIGVQDFAEGRFADAESRYRRALEFRPAFPEAAFNLGLALSRQKRDREAYAAFLRASDLSPGFYEAHREAGLSALRGGASLQDAERELRAAIALRPNTPEAAQLAEVLRGIGPAR